jgi:hypothetical protein
MLDGTVRESLKKKKFGISNIVHNNVIKPSLLPEIHELDGDGKFMGAHGGIKPVAVRAHD